MGVSGGFCQSNLWQKNFPKIQLRTIGQLLTGQGFDLPPRQPAYQPAARVRAAEGEQGALEELAGQTQVSCFADYARTV